MCMCVIFRPAGFSNSVFPGFIYAFMWCLICLISFAAFFAASRLLSFSECLHRTTTSLPTRPEGTQRHVNVAKKCNNDAKCNTSMWKLPGTSSAGHNTKPAGAVAGWESCGWSSWTTGSAHCDCKVWHPSICRLDKQSYPDMGQQHSTEILTP